MRGYGKGNILLLDSILVCSFSCLCELRDVRMMKDQRSCPGFCISFFKFMRTSHVEKTSHLAHFIAPLFPSFWKTGRERMSKDGVTIRTWRGRDNGGILSENFTLYKSKTGNGSKAMSVLDHMNSPLSSAFCFCFIPFEHS